MSFLLIDLLGACGRRGVPFIDECALLSTRVMMCPGRDTRARESVEMLLYV